MKLVALTLSWFHKGKIKTSTAKCVFYSISFWDVDWATDIAVFDVENVADRRDYERFLEEARKELDAKKDTKTLLDGLLSLRGWKTPAARQERARILGELEGRLAAVHIQRITVGKMKRTLLSYRTPKKAKKS